MRIRAQLFSEWGQLEFPRKHMLSIHNTRCFQHSWLCVVFPHKEKNCAWCLGFRVFVTVLCGHPCAWPAACCNSTGRWRWGWLLAPCSSPCALAGDHVNAVVWGGASGMRSALAPTTFLGMHRREVPKGSPPGSSQGGWAASNVKRTSSAHTSLDLIKGLAWCHGKQERLEQLAPDFFCLFISRKAWVLPCWAKPDKAVRFIPHGGNWLT